MRSPARPTRLVLTPLARAAAQVLSAAGLLATPLWLQAQVLPSGLQVAAGQASVATQGTQMTVRNSPNAILNWQSFSIGAANQVRFEQASAASKVLNRVTGNDPSQIFGSLTSNGQVWLLNPNGVLFGQGARVDVAGLVTSTLRLNDNDFLKGLYRFTALEGDKGTVRNEGAITSSNGGQIVLLGSRVENAGSIDAAGGSVALASASSVELVDTGLPNLSVKVDIPAGEVLNLGRLSAPGGRIDVYGAIVNQQGLVQADSLGPDAQGRIVLKASDTLLLADGSRTQAQGVGAAGGSVDLLGDKVALVGSAQVDASGTTGGGSVRVGGGLQGQDASVGNASAVFFGPDASIRADASGAAGDGGRIILWSDSATRAYGALSARGGSLTGNGGFVETSGGWLDARPARVDLGAAGQAGSWLLDPNTLFVNNTGPNTNITGSPNFTTTGDNAVISTATIASVLNAGTSVTLTTASGGTSAQAGDIIFSGATLSVNPSSAVGLTLRASRDILVANSSIVSNGAGLSLNLVAAASGKGAIEISNSVITTRGGNVTLGGATSAQVQLPDGSFTASTYAPAIGYDRTLDPLSSSLNNPGIGVNVRSGTVLTLGTGTFTATGRALANSSSTGVTFGTGSFLQAANVTLNGFNSAAQNSGAMSVVVTSAGPLVAIDADNSISILGIGGDGVRLGQGAQLTLHATGNPTALFDIKGYGGVNIADYSLSTSPTYAGTPITVLGGRLNVFATVTGSGFAMGLSGINVGGAIPTSPSIDLSTASGASFASVGTNSSGTVVQRFRISGPASGSVDFTSTDRVAFSNVAYVGSGALNIAAGSMLINQDSFAASGSGPLSLSFATTGSSPTGLTINNSTITTGGGSVGFGSLQQVCSPALGCTTVNGKWLEAGGNSGADPLAILNSTISAGSGGIYGGGAVRESANTSQGVYISGSTLSANSISLSGRSESNNGLQSSSSSFTATQTLTLDGLTAASAGYAVGLYLPQANTLRVNAPFDDPNAKLSLLGETRGAGNGIQVLGGEPSSNNATLISATGADLLLRGTVPASAQAPSTGLNLDGNSAAAGALTVAGAVGRTMDLSSVGGIASIGRTTITGSGTLNLSGRAVDLSQTSVTASGAPLNINFATTGSNPEGVAIDGSTLRTQGGSVQFGAAQTVCTASLGCTSAPAPWLEATSVGSPLYINQSSIDAGAGTVVGGGSVRDNTVMNTSVFIGSSTLKASSITIGGRAEVNDAIDVSGSTLSATRTLTLNGVTGSVGGNGNGIDVSGGSKLSVVDPGNLAGSQLSLIGEARGSGGTGLLIYGADPVSTSGATQITASGAGLLLQGSATGTYESISMYGLYAGGLKVSVSGGRTAEISALDGGSYLSQIAFSGAGTLNISGSTTALVDSAVSASGGVLNLAFATTGSSPGGVEVSSTTITTGGGDVRFGAVQQVCSPGLGCTATNGPWLEAAASGSYSPLVLSSATINAGGGRIYGGGAVRDPALQSTGVGLYDSTLQAAEIDLSGRADTADGLRVIGGSLSATRKLTLNGLAASSLGYENGLVVYPGSTLQVLDTGSNAGSLLRLIGESRGAGPGVTMSGGSTSPTLVVASGAGLLISGSSQGGPGVHLFNSDFNGLAGLRVDATGATSALVQGTTFGGGEYAILLQYAQVLGPNTGSSLQISGVGAPGGGNFAVSADSSSLSTGRALQVTGNGIQFTNSSLLGAQGVSMVQGAGGAAGSPVTLLNTTVATSAANADIVIGGTLGAIGKNDLNGGRGIAIDGSTLSAPGAGSRIVLNGVGSTGGGSGVSFTGTQMQAAGVQISGRGMSNADGVNSDAGSLVSGVATSRLQAVDLNITGQSDNGDGSSPNYAGVRLGSAVELALSGHGTATLSGDYVALGLTTSTAKNLKISGDAASFSVSSTASMSLRNATVDFSSGAGTQVTLRADSDGLNGGRARIESATIRTGGGNFVASGVGVIVGGTGSQAQNVAVGDGGTGVYMANDTIDAGAGTVTLSGSGPKVGGLPDTSSGFLGLATFSGTTGITARTITLDGGGGDKGVGIAIGIDQMGNSNGSVLNLSADTITVTGRGVGVSPGTAPAPYAGVLVAGGSNWLARNGGSLTVNSTGAASLTGAGLTAGNLSLNATGGALSVGNATLAATNRLRVQADGINLQTGAILSAAGTGDAIVLSTANGSLGGSFVNTAGANVLATPNGRWVLLLGSPAGTQLGGLAPAFTAYGLGTAPWQTDANGNLVTPGNGNALGFSADAGSLVAVSGLLTKVYDGTRSITLDPHAWIITGLLGTDQLTFTGSTVALLADKNVGTGKVVTLDPSTSFSVVSAGGQPVYGYAAPTFIANVTPATLVVSGLSAASKVYDATTVASLVGTATFTPLAVDSVSVAPGASGRFADKNVGNGKTVTPNALTLAGADAGNYNAVFSGTLTASITPLPVVISGLTAASKVYDTTTVATLAGTATVTALAGDSLGLGGTGVGSFADKNVGTAKAVSVTGYTLGGADAGNYSLLPLTGLTADITKASITLNGLTAANKVYDATTTAQLTGTAGITALPGDSVVLAGTGAGRFADKNVGTAKSVTVSGYSLGGSDAGNYQLGVPSTLTASISKASLTVSGLAAMNKVYDATVAAQLTGAAVVTALAGDVVGVAPGATGSFADKNVGTGKTVTLLSLSLTGADAGNYTAVSPTNLRADITPLGVVVQGLAAVGKVYDASTAATLTGTAGVRALAGDSLGLSGTGVGSFADKNVGTAKAVSVTGFALSGADAGNYSLQPPTGLSADITKATLTVAGLGAANKVYDGSTTAALTGTARVTPLSGDSVTLSGTGAGRFADKNVGTAKPVSVTGYTLSGTDAGNYQLQAPAGLLADITPALLTLGGLSAANRAYDGTTNATASATLGGVVSGDSIGVAFSARFADKNVGTAKPVSYTALLSGADASNYVLGGAASGSLSASITPLTLSYVADPQSSNSLSPLPVLTGRVTGFLGGETQANATTGTLTWTTPATSTSPAGSYAVNGSGLSAANYTFTQAPGNATALTLAPPLKVDLGPENNNTTTNNTTVSVTSSLQSVQVPVQMSTPTEGRVLDAVPALAATSTPTLESTSTTDSAASSGDRATTQAAANPRAGEGAPPSGVSFRAMNFQRMPRDEIQTLLAARAGFKKQVFATGVFKLEQDPTLADVRGCRTQAELAGGNCLITEQLKKEIQAAAQPRRNLRKVKQTVVPNIERKLALLIGVNKYKDQRVPELVGAIPDARAVKDLLEQRMGYEATVVEDPSREAIVRAFNKLALEADANDSVIIYYAGHGVVVPVAGVDTGFWLPADSNAEEPTTWLSNADIARLVTAIGARQLMLVSDSCYSGNLAGNERVQVEGQVSDPGELLKRKAVVVMSSGGNEPVSDEGREGHSVFAWHLMQSFKSLEGWQLGGGVFERVRAAVAKEFPQTPQYGAQRSAGHQGNTDYVFERREFESAAP
jgi:filamentous hemagglutinin family protein